MLSTALLSAYYALATTIIVVSIVLATIHTLFFRARNKGKLPPRPPAWPIIGNLPELLKPEPTFRWLHRLMKEMNTEIACVRFGNVHVIPVTCPKIGLEFLKEQDALFASRPYTMASSALSRNYLTVILPPMGEQWKKMRKILTSEVISPARHRWLHDKRMEEADNLNRYVFYHASSSSGHVNLRTAARHYCGNVIRKMVFNKRYFGDEIMPDGGPGIPEEEHVKAVFLFLKYLYAFSVSDYFSFLSRLHLDGNEKYVQESCSVINKYHDPIIDERMQQWRREVNPNDDDDTEKRKPQDLLDVLITLKDVKGNPLLSAEEIKAQIAELMIAAMDNPSNNVEWALAEMINQPELLRKATEELDAVVGKDRLVQESDIPNLNYIKACAREAFRLHPILPFTPPHVAMSDATVAGYFIPKGSHVILSRVGLGRNSKVWDEPLKYKPERHLSEEGAEVVVLTEPNLRFISFSAGRRGCIAANLGTAMTVMLLARLLQGFTWSPPSNMSTVDLTESIDELFLATPLIAQATPRLAAHLYGANPY